MKRSLREEVTKCSISFLWCHQQFFILSSPYTSFSNQMPV